MSGRFCQNTKLSSGAKKNISRSRVVNNDGVVEHQWKPSKVEMQWKPSNIEFLWESSVQLSI